MRHLLSTVVVALFTANLGVAADKPSDEDVKNATKAVQERLVKDYKCEVPPQRIENEAISNALPKHHAFAVMFRVWPIAERAPEGLQSANVVVAGPDGKATVITGVKELEDFFKAALPAAKEEKQKKDAALAWLRLVEQLRQDGYYTFEVVPEATKVSDEKEEGKKLATARSVVMKGGNGEISVELFFNDKGQLVKATETSKLKIGARPKCHATKLLDPDPVIRAIVEQDLLIMGRAARPYLDEQRAKASPELQKAIDRIWERIEKEDR
jgi:hypothetical protein